MAQSETSIYSITVLKVRNSHEYHWVRINVWQGYTLFREFTVSSSHFHNTIPLSLSLSLRLCVCVCARARACTCMCVCLGKGGEGEWCVSLYVTFGMAFRAHSDNPGGLSGLRIKTLPQGLSSHLQRPFSSFHIKKCYSSRE